LFHGRRVDDDIDAGKGARQPILVADVANEVAHRRTRSLWKGVAHLVLLEFVAAEDNQLMRPFFA
jgi:hypothetical protein